MVGQQPLKLRILVRAQAPEPTKNQASAWFFVYNSLVSTACVRVPLFEFRLPLRKSRSLPIQNHDAPNDLAAK